MNPENVEIGKGTNEVLPGFHLTTRSALLGNREVIFKAHIDGRPKIYSNATSVRRGQNFIIDFYSIDTGSDYIDPSTGTPIQQRPSTFFKVDGSLLPTVASLILEPDTALHLLQQLQALVQPTDNLSP